MASKRSTGGNADPFLEAATREALAERRRAFRGDFAERWAKAKAERPPTVSLINGRPFPHPTPCNHRPVCTGSREAKPAERWGGA